MRRLRYGYTTGACAAAAARGAALMLRDGGIVAEAEITLPRGERVAFPLHGQRLADGSASCFVVKDAGDDPDVTNGAEIHATVSRAEGDGIVIRGGTGVGRVTKPGLAVPPGEWAINPVPRKMIEGAVREVLYASTSHVSPVTSHGLSVVISIPDGEERATKTLNGRLGIIGGLSILGTTGIVTPVSARAWTDTIDAAVSVAVASGCRSVVLATGRTSELAAQHYIGTRDVKAGTRDSGLESRDSGLGTRKGDLSFPEEAFVMMGDHVGHALRSCAEQGVADVVLAAQFAKLVKIACGHGQTHVSSSELDLGTLSGWLDEAGAPALARLARSAGTARQLLEESGRDPLLLELVAARAADAAARFAPGLSVQVLLAGYAGEVIYCRQF